MRNIGLVLITLTLGGYASGSKPSQPTPQRPEPLAMAVPDGGTPGPGHADGGRPRRWLDKEDIRETITSNRGQIRSCYEAALLRAPKLHGKIEMRFTINVDGSVSGPAAVRNTVGDEGLAQCISDKLVTWRFPQRTDEGKVVVTYPFLFKPAEEPVDEEVPDAGP